MPTRALLYTWREIIVPFFGGVVFFTFVFLMFQAVRLADYFINHGVSIWLLAKLTVYISSAFLPVVLPLSFLVAVLVGFGRLSADAEIVAFKAAGISIVKLYLPVLVSSIAVSASVFYLAFNFIPWANLEFKRTTLKLGNTKVVSNLKEGTFTEGFFDLLVYADKVDADANQMRGVFIFDERDPKSPSVIVANRGTIIPQKTESDLSSAAIMSLENGAIHRPDASRELYEKIDFNEYNLLLKVDEGYTGEVSYPKTMTQRQIGSAMREYKSKNDQGHFVEYSIEYWRRVALGIAPLIFGVLGVGLGTVRMRSVKSNALLVCVSIVFVYWAGNLLGSTLAEKGWVPPFIGIQFSNFLAIPTAIVAFRRAMW
jgi:lipopolysaccharide export system permease protein